MDEEVLGKINALKGVVGITLADLYGEVLSSTISDEQLNEFITFLPGITPVIEEELAMGTIHRLMLKGPNEKNLTVFIESKQSLAVESEARSPIQVLTQQINEII